jgi:aminoglycoside phosphotransferase (APT) family kinase protein
MSGTLDTEAIRRILALADPEWELREAEPVERGFSRVARLIVETPSGTRDCVLKAAPEDGGGGGIPADARIMAVLDAQTAVPVPTVLAIVDEHDELPAPCYLAAAVEGTERQYSAVGWLDDDSLRTLARETGAALGQLHGLDAVDGFGLVRHAGPTLRGDAPSGRLDSLAVPGDAASWPEMVRAYADRELDRHADSRFADLHGPLREWIDDRIEALSGPFEPALCRNDHGLHNLLVDPDSGAVTAMLDWAYTLATPPAFDLEFAVYIYGGSYLAGISDVRDRRDLVRAAMLAGYRRVAPERADAVAERHPLYAMLAATRLMNDFDNLPPELPDGTGDAAAERLRADVASALDAGE